MATNDQAIDRIDRAILRVLASNGRIAITDLGQAVGLSKTPVAARIRRLEADGYITGYQAQLSTDKLGLAHVAFVEVRLSDTREVSLSAFNAAVRLIPEVEECHLVAGGFDYLLKVRTSDITDYRRVLSESISSLPNVASTSTYISMESVKDGSVVPL